MRRMNESHEKLTIKMSLKIVEYRNGYGKSCSGIYQTLSEHLNLAGMVGRVPQSISLWAVGQRRNILKDPLFPEFVSLEISIQNRAANALNCTKSMESTNFELTCESHDQSHEIEIFKRGQRQKQHVLENFSLFTAQVLRDFEISMSQCPELKIPKNSIKWFPKFQDLIRSEPRFPELSTYSNNLRYSKFSR